MKTILRFLASLLGLCALELHAAGSLRVNLSPSSAVSAGAQWRVDGGTWRNSGVSVSGLSNGSHTVDFKTVSGWVAPAATTAAITNGNTTTLAATYVQTAALKITLTPSAGQWSIDGGAWRTSGTTVTGLTPGNHTITYSAVSGYAVPATESVSLTSAQTTTLTRSYTQLSSLKITLTPSAGQWRVDGGAWLASGATFANLTPGAHTVDYNAVNGYTAPTSESVTLVSGQLTTLTRSYTPLSQLAITLTPTSAQWRVDGGAWQNSGTTVANLSPGSHTVSYAALNGYSAPASESVTLISGQTLSLSRAYVQLAQVTVTLTPASAQWRIDGGTWLTSGTTAANLTPGSHTIDYAAINGFIPPASESVTLSAGQSLPLSRSYVPLAQATVTLTPASAQWRLDGGAWRASGTTATSLSLGSHTIDYSAVAGYTAPSSESVTLTAGQSLSLTRAYVQLAQLTLTLTPTTAQWRLNGGAWQSSGGTLANLTPGSYTVEYSTLAAPNWGTPPTETVALSAGQSLTLTRNYTPLGQVLIALVPSTGTWRLNGGAWQASGTSLWVPAGTYTAEYSSLADYDSPPADTFTDGFATTRYYTSTKPTLRVHLVPTTGQWRVDGGAWQTSGAQVTDLTAGSHTLDYTDLGGDYQPLAAETVSLALRESATITRNYSIKPATLTVNLTPATGQWLLTGPTASVWRNSGETATGLTPASNYTIQYSSQPNYLTPPTEPLTLSPNQSAELTRAYAPVPAQVTVTLTPSSAQWRIDGGAWLASGATAANLAPGDHAIDYSALAGHVPPSAESVTLTIGQSLALTRSYPPLAQFTVTLTPSSAQWRLDGGAWQASGATLSDLPLGAHTVEYSTVSGYTTPSSSAVQLLSGPNTLATTYAPAPWQFKITLVPASAQFRVNGSPNWSPSGATTMGLTPGDYVVDFSTVQGYATPAPITLTLTNGDSRDLTVTYELAPAATLTVNLTPANAQWRVDQGPWNTSGATVIGLTAGSHFVEYTPRWGYLTPSAETIDLAANENRVLTRAYLTAPGYATVKTFTDAGSNPAILRGSDGALYVATLSGSGNDRGQVFRVNASGTGYTVLKSFTTGTNAPYAPTALIEGTDGALYGTTQYGGVTANKGTVFKLNKDGSGFAILRAFDGASDGSVPNALIEASDGLLYGTTQNSGGGTNIFRLAKDGSAFTRLGSTSGGRGVVEGPDGFLYSATATNTYGTFGSVAKMRKDGTGFVVLKTFNSSADGSAPRCAPLVGSDGVLYGTTSAGGTANKGVIYRLNLDGTGFAVVRSFLGDTTDGGRLDAPLSEGPDGALYGATYSAGANGRGTIFRLNKNGTGYTTLRHLAANGTEGGGNSLPVLIAPDSTLFSANRLFAGDGTGLLFKLSNDGSTFTALRSFGAPEGGMPRWVTEASDGALYGVTYRGGGAGYGGIFKVNKDGSGFSLLRGFPATNDGNSPQGQLLEASDGLLYGTTLGGSPSSGLLFKIAKDGTGYAIVHGFGGTNDGWGLTGGVIEGSDGQLYGSTIAGGALGGYGTLFRLNKDGSAHTILRSFANASADGNTPTSPPLEGPNGLLYGTTYSGGTANLGTLFSIAKDGTGYTVLHQFAGDATDGGAPYAKLFLGSDGRLYGTTSAGGAGGKGTVFAVNLNGTGYTVLKHFAGSSNDGATPVYAGVLEKNGILYGVTSTGGSFDSGTLYRLNLDGTNFQILLNFGLDSADGRLPAGGLIKTSDGAFYGTAPYGDNGGTLFRFGIN